MLLNTVIYLKKTMLNIVNIKKFLRYIKILGLSRSYVKVIGRLRLSFVPKLPLTFLKFKKKNVGIIGTGQFAFSTIAYFLKSNRGNVIYGAYDINNKNLETFSRYYNCLSFENPDELIEDKNIQYIYIASNHHSHTKYSIKAINAGKIVYSEKPISVNKKQFSELLNNIQNKTFYVGYNRPFSPAVQKTLNFINQISERVPITINSFIIGHDISKNHWYRDPKEGSRICGNVGHWIDLSIHFLNSISLPESLKINIISSSDKNKDDNLTISMVSNLGDLINITISSRFEPFEGISENIIIQYSDIISKIDDFRKIKIWKNDQVYRKTYYTKNVGHSQSIMQPFSKKNQRDFNEIKISTKLMLEINEAIKKNITKFEFKVKL